MKVYLNNVHRLVKYNSLLRWQIMKTIRLFLIKEGLWNVELGVILTGGDEHLARLNEEYRQKKGATDVLSFPFADNQELRVSGGEKEGRVLLGEIYISVDRAGSCRGGDRKIAGERNSVSLGPRPVSSSGF